MTRRDLIIILIVLNLLVFFGFMMVQRKRINRIQEMRQEYNSQPINWQGVTHLELTDRDGNVVEVLSGEALEEYKRERGITATQEPVMGLSIIPGEFVKTASGLNYYDSEGNYRWTIEE